MRDNPDSSYLSVWRLTGDAGEAGIVVVADYLLSSLISSVRFHAALAHWLTHAHTHNPLQSSEQTLNMIWVRSSVQRRGGFKYL